MLTQLLIKDIVLIEKLELSFSSGLAVLSGETGAGKSILLDATALALGARGEAGLVRSGQTQGQVSAVFEVSPPHAALVIAQEAGIETDGQLILRRVQFADGRTRGFINDVAVSAAIMRQIGEKLVEIHGQHADRALMEADAHRQVVDAFGKLHNPLEAVKNTWQTWRRAKKLREEAQERLEKARKEADFLKNAVQELTKLKAKVGEEEELATRRTQMQQSEKIASDLNDAYEVFQGQKSFLPDFSAAWRLLDRRGAQNPRLVAPIVKAMGEALDHIENARSLLEAAIREADFDPKELDSIEERLFALRAAARKFHVPADKLAELTQTYEEQLFALDAGEGGLVKLLTGEEAAQNDYTKAANALTQARFAAAKDLDAAVMAELPPLKLERAVFTTQITPLSPTSEGVDMVEFFVQTNPGTKAGPMFKVASGGELSRFMLALKVAMADKGSAPTLIFDEIDAGVGGAVADAIGERLRRLSQKVQVLCVTHAPQVASKASVHFLISKQSTQESAATRVDYLEPAARVEEIARMLSGENVTLEARAAAQKLLEK